MKYTIRRIAHGQAMIHHRWWLGRWFEFHPEFGNLQSRKPAFRLVFGLAKLKQGHWKLYPLVRFNYRILSIRPAYNGKRSFLRFGRTWYGRKGVYRPATKSLKLVRGFQHIPGRKERLLPVHDGFNGGK